MADPPTTSRDFQWDALCLPTVNPSSLDDPFTELEVLVAIRQLPCDKAPRPDDYMGYFFKACWSAIVAAINYFHMGRCENLNLVNKANIVLIPKKMGQSWSRTSGQSVFYPRRYKNHQQITSNTTSTENEGTHLPLPKCLHKGKKHPRQLPLRQKYCAALEEASTTTFFTSKILCSASIVTDTFATHQARHLKSLWLCALGLPACFDAA